MRESVHMGNPGSSNPTRGLNQLDSDMSPVGSSACRPSSCTEARFRCALPAAGTAAWGRCAAALGAAGPRDDAEDLGGATRHGAPRCGDGLVTHALKNG
eukprot:Skav213158  [mRNA]  locus=scaffold31:111100:111396:- [translate_table: standard]